MAVGSIKHEHVLAARENAVQKTALVWLAAPVLSGVFSFFLLSMFGV
jgi:phosphate/sulfate permease